MLKFLKCFYCSDIILLTKQVKACGCGHCTGAETGAKADGSKLYSHSGRGMTFQIPEEALNGSEGSKFIGFISSVGHIKLGTEAKIPYDAVVVR